MGQLFFFWTAVCIPVYDDSRPKHLSCPTFSYLLILFPPCTLLNGLSELNRYARVTCILFSLLRRCFFFSITLYFSLCLVCQSINNTIALISNQYYRVTFCTPYSVEMYLR